MYVDSVVFKRSASFKLVPSIGMLLNRTRASTTFLFVSSSSRLRYNQDDARFFLGGVVAALVVVVVVEKQRVHGASVQLAGENDGTVRAV